MFCLLRRKKNIYIHLEFTRKKCQKEKSKMATYFTEFGVSSNSRLFVFVFPCSAPQTQTISWSVNWKSDGMYKYWCSEHVRVRISKFSQPGACPGSFSVNQMFLKSYYIYLQSLDKMKTAITIKHRPKSIPRMMITGSPSKK